MRSYSLSQRLVAAAGAAACIMWCDAPSPGFRDEGAAVAAPARDAVSGSWVRSGGPLGGLGYDIRMQPDNPDIMYVTDAFAGVHKSTDGGVTWTVADNGIDARTGPSNDAIPVFCLTIDPNNYNTLWIGMTGIRGVYRSTDAGANWTRKDTGIIEDNGLTIRGIGVKPGDSNTVFVAGEVASYVWNGGTAVPGREFDKVQGVIYRSTNAGQNWSEVWRGDNLARYILFDSSNANIVYASTGLFDREAKNSNPGTNAPGGVGVLKSTNGGSSWTALTAGLGNLYIDSLFIHPTNSQILLAGAANNAYPANGGIYRSTNAGASWTLVGNASEAHAVEFSTTSPNRAYAASASQFFRSIDAGLSWTLLNIGGGWGPAGIRPGFPIDLQVDPRDPQRVFVNNYGGGNFLSRDGGSSWTSASTGYTGADLTDVFVDPVNAGRVYAIGRSGPYKSANSGNTWTGINPLNEAVIAEGARIAVDPSNPDNILMSSAHWGWTFRSTNRGVSWALVTNFADELAALPVPDTNQRFQGMQAIAFAPSLPSTVYGGFGVWRCATEVQASLCNTAVIASIFTSHDGGATWTRHNNTLFGRSVSRIVVDPQDPAHAWAATLGDGVFVTTDGGSTWNTSNSGLGNLNVWALAGAPSNAAELYAGTFSSGIYKSTNGGATWMAASSGMSANEPITSIVVDPADANVVYAGSRSSGVYVSTNAGGTWSLNSTALRQRAVQALALSADGTLLYAATKGEGVYRLGIAVIPPGVPTGATATPENARARIAFSAPPSSGSAAITSYTVTASPGGANSSGGSSPIIVTGLANGTGYTFTVTATSSAGTSDPSAPSSAVTPGANLLPFFTDDPLEPGTTTIKAAHLTELRSAINTLRSRAALSAFVWTDTTIDNTVTIRAVHLTELRAALQPVYIAASQTQPTYSAISAGSTIAATHLAEIRAAIAAIY